MARTSQMRQGVELPSVAPMTHILKIGDGWTAIVLDDPNPSKGEGSASVSVPDVEIWRAWLVSMLDDPAALPGYAVLKFSETGEVFRARICWDERSLDVVCKQSRSHGLVRYLLNRFFASREWRNFNRAFTLVRAGIGTARPLAIVGRRGRAPASWLVTEYLADPVDLDQLTLLSIPRLDPPLVAAVKRRVTKTVADLFAGLANLPMHHRDMKASNVLLTDWDSAEADPRAYLVDLDGLGPARAQGGMKGSRMLVRLAASLVGYSSLTRSDYGRFLRMYLSRIDCPPGQWKAWWRALSPKVEDYRRRAAGRKADKLDRF